MTTNVTIMNHGHEIVRVRHINKNLDNPAANVENNTHYIKPGEFLGNHELCVYDIRDLDISEVEEADQTECLEG